MSAVALLLGLLVLSYVGSMLVSDRTIRGFGLPSGAEYLLLGFVLGPHALGVLGRSLVSAFEPVLIVGVSWVALVLGVGYGQIGSRRLRLSRALSGIAFSAFVAAGVAGITFVALLEGSELGLAERLLVSGAAGAVSCETTRHAVRWVAERHGSRGELSELLADLSRTSVFVPAAVFGVLFAAAPGQELGATPVSLRVGITLGLGVVLGLVATLLLGREFRRDESWGILLGTSLLAIGVTARLGLSPIAAAFAMGLTVSTFSPHRADLKAMVAPSERPVMVPVAVLAGAYLDLEAAPFLWLLVGAAFAARLILDLLRAGVLALIVPQARAAGPALGLGLVPSSAFTLGCGLLAAIRIPGAVGGSVLVLAAASVLAGELIGPLSLRRALERAGDIVPGRPFEQPPPSIEPRASRTTLYDVERS
ncbi:MAG TPA: potassium transporter Kef [Polyangiaceae bacterium]|nr:potassium transporter Kef [Polyangiaceae bacterium]